MSIWRKPVAPQAARVPQAPARRRSFERAGRVQRPLAGPSIPIPPDQDEQLLAEYAGWRQQTNGSLPEFVVWKWLIDKKRQVDGRDFIYQSAIFGGRTSLGGFVLDFWFPLKGMGWRVQGLRWHILNPRDRANDLLSKQILEGRGIRVIDLWEDQIMTSTDYVLGKAWEGQEVSIGRSQ